MSRFPYCICSGLGSAVLPWKLDAEAIRNLRHRVLFFISLLAIFEVSVLANDQDRPNIVIFVADDLGWGDVGWHGSEIPTPHLDRLATRGARLESFYVQPVCTPTRAALLTGRYPIRHGLQTGVIRPWAQYGLPLEEQTLPQALKSAGYATAIIGKWHLGHFREEYLPTRRGFDLQYGHYNGALDYFNHKRDGGLDWHRNDQVCHDEGYSTHLIANEAVDVINRFSGKQPFLLYVPFNAVHAPHQVPEQYLESFPQLHGERRIYAGMLAAMDEAIGKIVSAVEKQGIQQKTLFIFTSDNGGPQPGKVTSNGKLRAGKATVYEGGVRAAAFATWEGKIPQGTVVNEPLHVSDWYPTLLRLANVEVEQRLPLDGKDAWGTIALGAPSPHQEILINATPHAGAIRSGQWKLVVNGSKATAGFDGEAIVDTGDEDTLELFDLHNDPYEEHNLFENQAAIAKDLFARWDRYRKEALPPKAQPKPDGFESPAVWGVDPSNSVATEPKQ